MPEQLRCEACGINFETKEAMMEHSAKVHKMTPPAPHQHEHFKCQSCGAEFESMEELQAHGKKSHANVSENSEEAVSSNYFFSSG